MSNNGFDVINLGIKVPPEQLIEACRRENPDMVGLSGLLVKSAQQMVLTAQDMKAANLDLPVLVGGAALTRKFTDQRIAPQYEGLVLYAKDAMNGLELANRLRDDEKRRQLVTEVQRNREKARSRRSGTSTREEIGGHVATKVRVSTVNREAPVYPPPDYRSHILRNYPISHLEPYINKQMLLGKHLGLKGNVEQLLLEGDPRATDLKRELDEMVAELREAGSFVPTGSISFFRLSPTGRPLRSMIRNFRGRKCWRPSPFPGRAKPLTCVWPTFCGRRIRVWWTRWVF